MKKTIVILISLLATNFAFSTSPALKTPFEELIELNSKNESVKLALSQIQSLQKNCKGEFLFVENEIRYDGYFSSYHILARCDMEADEINLFESSLDIEAVFSYATTESKKYMFLSLFESRFNQVVPSAVSIGTK